MNASEAKPSERAADEPRPAHAPARGGAVAQLAEDRVADEGEQRADAQDQRQVIGGLRRRQLLQAQGQRDHDGRQEREPGAGIGRRIDRNEAPAAAREGARRREVWRLRRWRLLYARSELSA